MHNAALSRIQKINHKFVMTRLKQQHQRTSRYESKTVPQDEGFTLIEFLVIAILVGILATIAVPNWLAFVSRQRVNEVNDIVLSSLQEAQRQAKQKKLTYSVSFRTNNGVAQIAVYQGTTPSNWTNLGSELGINSRQILLGTNLGDINKVNSSNTVIYASDFNSTSPQTISFDYMGTLPNDPSFGTPPGLKIVVAVPRPGTTNATNVKRCVIVANLIGGMRTAKDAECN